MCRFNISFLMDAPLFQAHFEKRMPRDFSKSLGNPFQRVLKARSKKYRFPPTR
jgi:hypothetical protein